MTFGAIEFGGTKTLVAVGTSPSDLSTPLRVPTTDPATTMAAVIERLSAEEIDAVGVSAFGPLELRESHPDFGSITTTPKPRWSGTPIHAWLKKELGVPVGIDTDVNGAALGEGEWGAARGLKTHLYMTVGTGVGLGAVVEGRTLKALGHPEFGHVIVRRIDDDAFPGACPFHGDCLEGMAAGPALEQRFGSRDGWDEPAEVARLATSYVSQSLRTAVYAYAPERIVVGGGVSKLPGFHEMVHAKLVEELAGYPGIEAHRNPEFVSPPGLGDRSGLAGALVVAATSAR